VAASVPARSCSVIQPPGVYQVPGP
jgi:hypothetical protein